jgi:hypothetical protein
LGGDRSGGNADALRIASGETAVLGDVRGAGCVKHVWVTLMSIPADPHELCKVVLRMYWDGEESPSVEVPVGDFFGMGFGLRRNFASLPLQMSPEDGKGFNCWFPMPFADGARFEVDNQGEALVIFYYYIDYEEYAEADPELARFHALWNRNPVTAGIAAERGWTRADYRLDASRPAGPGLGFGAPWSEPNLTGERNYVILDVAGRGQYVGCVLNVDVFERQVNDWYGEGDDMIFIDGEPWPPRLHGTGTEEWPWGGKNSMYRFHVEDGRRPRLLRGGIPPVGSTVDVATATYQNSIGDPGLTTVWTDSDFDPAEHAFYYVRVIEIPTPRWTAYDAVRFDLDLPDEIPMTTQERAYTSPIWYSP